MKHIKGIYNEIARIDRLIEFSIVLIVSILYNSFIAKSESFDLFTALNIAITYILVSSVFEYRTKIK